MLDLVSTVLFQLRLV